MNFIETAESFVTWMSLTFKGASPTEVAIVRDLKNIGRGASRALIEMAVYGYPAWKRARKEKHDEPAR